MQEKRSIKFKNSLKTVPAANVSIVHNEPLLKKENNISNLFPIQHNAIWQAYKIQQATIWNIEQINFLDAENVTLPANETYYLKHLLSFLAFNNQVKSKKLATRLLSEVQYTEAQFFYAIQLMKENIHTEAHSLLIDSYIKEKKERLFLHNTIKTFPAIRKKEAWTSKWVINGSFSERLVASAIVEEIFFSGSYCSIFWINQEWKIPELTSSIELIYRDKRLHKNFACLLYSEHLKHPLSSAKAAQIICQAIDIEIEFTTESLPVKLIGIKHNLMVQYLQYVANKLMIQLGYEKIYNATNPFDFMDMIAFSEKLGVEYQKLSVVNKLHEITPDFNLTEKF